MGFAFIFIVLTLVLPLVVLLIRRNFLTLLLTYTPWFVLAYLHGRRLCLADRLSEACTWAYFYYFYALAIASVLYLVVTAIQWGRSRLKREQQPIDP